MTSPTGALDEVVHPRPQLTRPWVDLSGPWDFRYDDEDAGLDAGWPVRPAGFDRTVLVPFPPESKASGIGDDGFHPVVWYRRGFQHRPRPGRRLLLHFGAVDYRAQVWVNGRLVAEHEGGHTPVQADVTSVLRPDGGQELVVRAEDQPGDLRQPRGKQDWERHPHAIWYRRTTGIWQPVWLEDVPATRIEALRWTADLDRAQLSLTARVHRADDRPLRLRVRLSLRGMTLAEDDYAVAGEEIRRDIGISPGALTLGRKELAWAPEHPNLIDATVELHDADGPLDSVGSYTAQRSAAAGDGRFLLNGQPYFLRLVLAQGFWPDSHLAAPDAGALRREVEPARP